MTPVARGISDADNQHLIFIFGFLQCFISPGVPVHRIMGMLKQIGAAFVDKLICVFMHYILFNVIVYRDLADMTIGSQA
jgi:hypothetical protein